MTNMFTLLQTNFVSMRRVQKFLLPMMIMAASQRPPSWCKNLRTPNEFAKHLPTGTYGNTTGIYGEPTYGSRGIYGDPIYGPCTKSLLPFLKGSLIVPLTWVTLSILQSFNWRARPWKVSEVNSLHGLTWLSSISAKVPLSKVIRCDWMNFSW